MSRGTLYGLGVGPGDPELLTLKAVRILHQADVIAVPDKGSGEKTAFRIVQEYVEGKSILTCVTPMVRDQALLDAAHDRIADDICALLEEGKSEKEAARAAEKRAIEDARFVLPNACETKMVCTFNARSLQNFFALRCCNRAQWEIRDVATQMLFLGAQGCAASLCKRRPWLPARHLSGGEDVLRKGQMKYAHSSIRGKTHERETDYLGRAGWKRESDADGVPV